MVMQIQLGQLNPYCCVYASTPVFQMSYKPTCCAVHSVPQKKMHAPFDSLRAILILVIPQVCSDRELQCEVNRQHTYMSIDHLLM